MTSVLLPGLALIVLFGLISGLSTGTRLFAFSWLRRKICVMTWSPRRPVLADGDGAGLQLGVGFGNDLEQAIHLDDREAEPAQRREEVEVGLARRQRLLAVERDRAAHARIDDELLAQDRRHRACDALDLGVDEVQGHRLAAKACRARRLREGVPSATSRPRAPPPPPWRRSCAARSCAKRSFESSSSDRNDRSRAVATTDDVEKVRQRRLVGRRGARFAAELDAARSPSAVAGQLQRSVLRRHGQQRRAVGAAAVSVTL